MTQEGILKSLLEIEKQNGLYDLYFEDIPVWNILKYRLRGYNAVENGINDITNSGRHKKKKFPKKIKDFYNSFLSIKEILSSRKKIPYCFVGFPRLEKINDVVIDKFIDPVISECNFNDDEFIYFNNEYDHPINRNKEHDIIYTDFIVSLSYALFIILFPFFYFRNRKTFKKLSQTVRLHFSKNRNAVLYLYVKPTIIYIQHYFYKLLFKRFNTKSLIGVSRPTFLAQAVAAKKLGIPVIELQHGITHGLTALYSGVYKREIDPDYFCTFGESCPSNVFNIDEAKIVNIGFALNSYLKKFSNNKKNDDKCILVISEPETSEAILNVVFKLARKHPSLEFHIRRHPQEFYSETQIEKIKETKNVKDVSSKECSQLAILPYKYIIGDNSSVLFEALSVGKNVARLNCEGLKSNGYKPDVEDGFCYINDLNEFEKFLYSNKILNRNKIIYSDFNKEIFKELISK